MSTITRSGTNQFHGTAFEYLRNEKMDANDWFSNSLGLPKADLRQHHFGGVLGGPVLRDRTFFFFSTENLLMKLPQTEIVQVPSIALRESAASSIRPLMDAFPIPNGQDLGNGFAELAVTYSDPTRLHATSLRIDDRLSERLTLFGRYNEAPSFSEQRLFSLSDVRTTRTDTRTATVGATYIPGASVVNELRANYSRVSAVRSDALDDFHGARPPDDGLLYPSFAGPENAQIGVLLPFQRFFVGTSGLVVQNQLNIVDNLTIVSGAHQWKVGVDYRRMSPSFGASYLQFVTFATANDVRVSPARYSITGVDPVGIRLHNLSAYAQDTWRASRRLTFTYGLRWELNPSPEATGGKELYTFRGIDDPSTLQLAPAGTPLYQTTWTNIAPRLGAAYVLSDARGRETVLRGGYGLFYDLGAGTSADVARRFPYYRTKSFGRETFPLDAARAAPPDFNLNPPYNASGSFIGKVIDGDLQLP